MKIYNADLVGLCNKTEGYYYTSAEFIMPEQNFWNPTDFLEPKTGFPILLVVVIGAFSAILKLLVTLAATFVGTPVFG